MDLPWRVQMSPALACVQSVIWTQLLRLAVDLPCWTCAVVLLCSIYRYGCWCTEAGIGVGIGIGTNRVGGTDNGTDTNTDNNTDPDTST